MRREACSPFGGDAGYLPLTGADIEDAVGAPQPLRGQREDLLLVLRVGAVGEAVLPPVGVLFPEVE